MTKEISFVSFIIRYFVFLVICFILQRFVFFAFNFNSISSAPFSEILFAFVYSLRLDFSMSAYFMLFPLVIGSITRVFNFDILNKTLRIIFFILCVLFALIGVSNAALYNNWNSIINTRALNYIQYPKEIFASLTSLQLTLFPLIIALLAFLNWFIYKKIAGNFSLKKTNSILSKIVLPLVVLFVLGVIGRGGLQLSPINESSVYFSNTPVINHLAINCNWHLAADLLVSSEENTYTFFEKKNKHFNFFKCENDSSTQILNTDKPNIIFIVVESFSANAIAYYGCKENLTPNFDSLIKKGLVFDSIYSSGFRTEQGLINIYSGFPAQPNQSIITQPAKAEKLNSLFTELKAKQYYSTFYYGGEIEFANIGAYLRQNKIDKIITEKDFNSEQKNSKWGAHDEYLFEKIKQEIQLLPQPFFVNILTLTNHEPFETPNSKTNNNEQNGFKKTVKYTDSCLGNFIGHCSKQKWYSNSLFVLVADHGHRLPYNVSMDNEKAKHIPLLFFGGALKDEFKGTSISKIANQHDIPATILNLITKEKSNTKFPFSQSILNPSCYEYAYFTNENVLGWKEKNTSFTYSFADKKITIEKGNKPDSTTINKAKSFLQNVYQTYLSY